MKNKLIGVIGNINVIPNCKEFACNIYQNTNGIFIEFNTSFYNSWEQALEAGLQAALELIK